MICILRQLIGPYCWLLFVLISSVSLSSSNSDYLDNQIFLDTKSAEKRWGAKIFSPEGFKNGSLKLRAQMAASLQKGNHFVGKTPNEIKATLGPFTGHFWSGMVPAYLIEEGWNLNSDSWQLVFLLDDAGKVKEIRIHKNCCN